jgi:glycosyltransferase involved in cell wall biosynthesis
VAAGGVPAARIEITQNGIVPAAFPPAPARRAGPLVLGFVGFVRDWHGLDTIIAALARPGAAGLHLLVVGEGPARAALEQQAAELGIADRVRFTGLAAHDAVPDLVAGFDIALQPRVVAYASPLKIFEYMAAGRAIVAPDQPNIREILEHERTALLFDPAEPDGAWQAIARLAADADLRDRLGHAARAEITRRDYTWQGNAERIVTWAQSDLSSRATVPAALSATR